MDVNWHMPTFRCRISQWWNLWKNAKLNALRQKNCLPYSSFFPLLSQLHPCPYQYPRLSLWPCCYRQIDPFAQVVDSRWLVQNIFLVVESLKERWDKCLKSGKTACLILHFCRISFLALWTYYHLNIIHFSVPWAFQTRIHLAFHNILKVHLALDRKSVV